MAIDKNAYLLLNDVDYKSAHIVKAVNEFISTNNPLCLRQYVSNAMVPMTLVIEQFKTMALTSPASLTNTPER